MMRMVILSYHPQINVILNFIYTFAAGSILTGKDEL